jgi:hypothetical protein
MSVSGYNATRFQGTPQEFPNRILRGIHADFLLHIQHKSQHILSCKTMQWTSETKVSGVSHQQLPIETR